ncbi:MAG: DEAD/DEAH box helicase [Balneolaceae bacterium]
MKDLKIESPTPQQKKIIKAIQEGNDLLIKTAEDEKPESGYLVPILDQIAKQDRRQGTKAIVLTSGSNRAHALDKWIWGVGYHAGIECAPVTDEGEKQSQKDSLSAGPTMIAATPARLAELMEENRVVFREVQFLVLDSADQIEDWEEIQTITQRIIGKCQRIVCVEETSESLIQELDQLLNDPETIGFKAPEQSKQKENGRAPESIEITKNLTQYYIKVPPRMKISTLMSQLENNSSENIVIFTASRRTADRLYRVLRKSGRRAASIHSKLDKKTYDERLERFTSNNVQHLIVGELSAEDLNLDSATQVINYDVPEEIGEYKLRAELLTNGKGTRILSLVSKQDRSDIREIIEKLGYAPEEIPLPDSVDKKISRKRGGDKSKSKKKSGQKSRDKKQKPKRSRPSASKKSKTESISGLPRPSYDKLSGGRSGKKKEEKSGITGFFKKLFSDD